MQLAFSKMHGTGNRILVVDERGRARTPPTSRQLRLLGNEATGPGFDQLMWVESAADADLAARYRVFNADGSEVEQCGNGVRCVAWLLAREGATSLRLASPAGIIDARVLENKRVAVSMGPPEFEPARIPFVADKRQRHYVIDVDGQALQTAVLSMGNPHCVIEVNDVTSADVATLGPALEHHERFPERCNVGFMQVKARDVLDLRVFERGVGETQACGTGACAAVVAAQQSGLVDDEVRVNLPGGQLVVSWRGDADNVWLTGDVELLSEGIVDL